MSIFIDICIVIAISGVLYLAMLLICKYGTKNMNIRCTLGVLMVALGVSCLLNGVLVCLALSAYGYLPKI